jgi:hypothetical protein
MGQTVKKEEKNKSEEPKPKVDETLPLWWTDKTAAAPCTPQLQPAPPAVVDTAAPTSQTLLTHLL